MSEQEKRVWNFSAGPAMLPLSSLKKVQEELLSYKGLGYSIMETSHRSKVFNDVLEDAKTTLAKLLNIDESFAIMFLHGSATMEFLRIPMNFLHSKNDEADYILSGHWAKKASKEAERIGSLHIAASSQEAGFRYIPKNGQISLSKKSKYAYICSNNTIFGTQFHDYPDTGSIPLLGDFSSDILCRKREYSKFSLIFACAQKNLGPAGISIVAIKKDFLETASSYLPPMLSYKELFNANSVMNTPPVFCIYFMREVLHWIEERGLEAIELENEKKARLLYDVIDSMPSMYAGVAAKEDRSIMNVTWNFKNNDLMEKFLDGAEKRDLFALKGHRAAGGIRASIYNAMPLAGVEALASYMKDFARENA